MIAGEPHFRQLEPACWLAAPFGAPPTCRVTVKVPPVVDLFEVG